MALMGSSGCVDTSVGFDSALSVQLLLSAIVSECMRVYVHDMCFLGGGGYCKLREVRNKKKKK